MKVPAAIKPCEHINNYCSKDIWLHYHPVSLSVYVLYVSEHVTVQRNNINQNNSAAFMSVHDLTTQDNNTRVHVFKYGSLGRDLADIWCDGSLTALVVNVFTQIAWLYCCRAHASAIKTSPWGIFQIHKRETAHCACCIHPVTLAFPGNAKAYYINLSVWQRWVEMNTKIVFAFFWLTGRLSHVLKKKRGGQTKGSATPNLPSEACSEAGKVWKLSRLPGRARGRRRGSASAEVGSRVCTVLHCLQTPFCSKWDWLMLT